MFRDITQAVEVTQGHLKALEGWRQAQGADESRQLRQVSPEAGKLLAILLASCPPGDAVELGSGGGYSGLWLALACRATQRRLVTFERDPNKATLARHCLEAGDVLDFVELREADGLTGLGGVAGISFCFIDAEPSMAREAYEAALSLLPSGGVVAIGDAIERASEFQGFLDDAEMDARVDAVLVPIGSGLLICRKV